MAGSRLHPFVVIGSPNISAALAVGAAVAATGAANALVWWNGAQWTVMGI